jgi:hypothetical protein
MTEMSDISKTATLTPVKRPETGPAGPETSRPGGFESLKALFKKLDPKNSENCLKNGVTNALALHCTLEMGLWWKTVGLWWNFKK